MAYSLTNKLPIIYRVDFFKTMLIVRITKSENKAKQYEKKPNIFLKIGKTENQELLGNLPNMFCLFLTEQA